MKNERTNLNEEGTNTKGVSKLKYTQNQIMEENVDRKKYLFYWHVLFLTDFFYIFQKYIKSNQGRKRE